jgi:hypothetical protein
MLVSSQIVLVKIRPKLLSCVNIARLVLMTTKKTIATEQRLWIRFENVGVARELVVNY